MSENYLKSAKLYTLNTTGVTTISGAGFIHGIYNATNAATIVIVDNAHRIHLTNDGNATFPVPLTFSNIRMFANNTTGVILYS